MDHHQAPPISGSWSPGAARAVDGALLLHGPLRVDRNAETEKKLNGWMDRAWTQRQGTQYRPSCLIEAYDRPENYWLVWAGPLASHLFNFNLIFLSDGLMAAAERAACFSDLYRR
jgi:hypothetical protein